MVPPRLLWVRSIDRTRPSLWMDIPHHSSSGLLVFQPSCWCHLAPLALWYSDVRASLSLSCGYHSPASVSMWSRSSRSSCSRGVECTHLPRGFPGGPFVLRAPDVSGRPACGRRSRPPGLVGALDGLPDDLQHVLASAELPSGVLGGAFWVGCGVRASSCSVSASSSAFSGTSGSPR